MATSLNKAFVARYAAMAAGKKKPKKKRGTKLTGYK